MRRIHGLDATTKAKTAKVLNLMPYVWAFMVLTFLGVCAVRADDSASAAKRNQEHISADQIKDTEINDPWEEFNRSVFAFNEDLDYFLITPVTEMYRFVLPDAAQASVHNFLGNLSQPLTLVHDIFQLEGDRAMDTIARFFINTTLGLFGIFDPADEVFGITPHTEDFGQTMGAGGVSGEPYLVLPLFGPSSPRDAIGRVVDFFIDPTTLYLKRQGHQDLVNARFAVDVVDKRNYLEGPLKSIRAAPDPYVRMRSYYMQNRTYNVKNEQGELDSPTPSEE